MRQVTDIINKEIHKIENVLIDDNLNSTNRAISMYMLSLWKKNQELPGIKQLSELLFISISGISKFIKKYNLQTYQVLKFMYAVNSTSRKISDEEKENNDPQVQIAVKAIKESEKILLLGAGNSGLIAKSFYTLLVLKGYRAIYVDGKPDQMKLLSQMKQKDLVICVSSSLSHQWTKNLIKSNKKIILFTSQSMNYNKNIIPFFPRSTTTLKNNVIDYVTSAYINKKIDDITNIL